MYPETLRGGRLGGPVAFFDHDYTAVVIMSPLNNFMAANMETELDVLNFGLMGSIEVRYSALMSNQTKVWKTKTGPL